MVQYYGLLSEYCHVGQFFCKGEGSEGVFIVYCVQVWIHVSSDREDKVTKQKKPLLESVIEKKSIVNLVNLVISF